MIYVQLSNYLYLHTIIRFQVFLIPYIQLYGFKYSYLIQIMHAQVYGFEWIFVFNKIIYLSIVIWSQVFPKISYTSIWFQVYLSDTKNLCTVI